MFGYLKIMETADTTSLSTRDTLPDDLCFLLAKYPRSQWQIHPNLGSMAQFWLERHAMFRDLGGQLKNSVHDYRQEKLQAQPFAQFFVPRLQFFLQQLNGHHHIEDSHYFPIFAAAEKRLERGFDILDKDHHTIHDALEANAGSANAFLQKLGGTRDDARFAADAYADNVERLIALLLRHLDDEEDLIIPLILDRGEQSLGI